MIGNTRLITYTYTRNTKYLLRNTKCNEIIFVSLASPKVIILINKGL